MTIVKHVIKEITSEETLAIRHKVMWPNKSIDYIRIPNDSTGSHYGLFLNDKLISVISLFIQDNSAQFRKFATLSKYQGIGFGSVLLREIIEIVKRDKLSKIWCNARIDKSNFYTKFGLNHTDIQFQRGGIDYVIMEKTLF